MPQCLYFARHPLAAIILPYTFNSLPVSALYRGRGALSISPGKISRKQLDQFTPHQCASVYAGPL